MSIVKKDKNYWGLFSPDLLIVSSILGICTAIEENVIDGSAAEEYLFNPETISFCEEIGCQRRIINMFSEGIAIEIMLRNHPDMGKDDVLNLKRRCLEIIDNEVPSASPDL